MNQISGTAFDPAEAEAFQGRLADVLNGAEPRPLWKTHTRLEQEYGAAL